MAGAHVMAVAKVPKKQGKNMCNSYKLSFYLISVNFFDAASQLAKTLVFSTRTSKLKILDRGLWEAINKLEINNLSQIILKELLEAKILVNSQEDEIENIINENKQHINCSTHLYMSIQPSAACPLGCGYCGQKHEDKNMNLEVQDALLERMKKKLSAGNFKSLGITWFGGEPIAGYSVIKKLSPKIIELAKQFSLKYSSKIVTNGYLLHSQMINDLLEKYNITQYEITLDGIDTFHDQRRHTKAHGKTFASIYDNILYLAKLPGTKIIIRCNVDARNRAGVEPLLQKLKSDGLHELIDFYVAPIHSWGNQAHLLAAEHQEFAQWEIGWLIDMIDMGFKVKLLPNRSHSVCFTVNPMYELIDPFGDIFSCSEVSLVPKYVENDRNIYSLGSVLDEQVPAKHQTTAWGDFYSKDKLSHFDCITCNMLPTCGGGCPKEWSEGRAPCPSTKFNISQRMLLTYALIKQQQKPLGMKTAMQI